MLIGIIKYTFMYSTHTPDSVLLDKLKKYDSSAFDYLFRKYSGRLFNFALSTLYNKALAEDIVQSAFLYVWEHREDIDVNKNFSAYLYTITKNMIYRQTERKLLAYKYEEYVKSNESEEDPTPEKTIDAKSLEALIMELINQLPEARRNVFLLSRQKQMSNKEIAELLDISEKTVDTQIRRSLDFLRRNLGDELTVLALLSLSLA